MAARPKNQSLVYLRRSTSRQEASLETQLQWAIAEATRLDVVLEAVPADLERMRAGRLHAYRDIRLDDGITGADLRRPGFLALRRDAVADPAISHVFIHRRDRHNGRQRRLGRWTRRLCLSGFADPLAGNPARAGRSA